MSDKKEVDYKSLYNSLASAVEGMSNENKRLAEMNDILVAEKKQWEGQKVIQEQVISQQLGNSDGVVGKLQDEIRSIKSQLCEACYKKVR